NSEKRFAIGLARYGNSVYIPTLMKAKMLGSFARKPLRQLAFLCLAGLFSATFASAQTPAPEWRTWTSNDGAQIEAYLREVRENGQIVIVRRDGQEFVTA